MDYSNIPTGLKITSQIPLNVKEWCKNEATLAYLGVDDNLAFTYHDQLIVNCLEEKSKYIWREVQPGEENTGLVPLDFTYPTGLLDIYGINYSGKKYNFFLKEYVTSDMIVEQKDIVSPNGSVTITETPTQIQLTVPIPTGAETKIINGLQTTVTGTGTTLDPYKIDGKLYQAGTGITITGLGTSISPYIISTDNTNGNIGWLKGDTKEVVCTKEYLHLNFNNTGLGINERVGWAIMNGSTHTYNGNIITVPNDNGRTVIAYGINYSTLEAIGGNKDAVVVEHSHSISTSPNDEFGYVTSKSSSSTGGTPINTSTVGESGIDKNMQPYVVRLRIMKL